jgi:hypothetical protein
VSGGYPDLKGHFENGLETNTLFPNIAGRLVLSLLCTSSNSANGLDVCFRETSLIAVEAKRSRTLCQDDCRLVGRVMIIISVLDQFEKEMSRCLVKIVGKSSWEKTVIHDADGGAFGVAIWRQTYTFNAACRSSMFGPTCKSPVTSSAPLSSLIFRIWLLASCSELGNSSRPALPKIPFMISTSVGELARKDVEAMAMQGLRCTSTYLLRARPQPGIPRQVHANRCDVRLVVRLERNG